MEISQTARSGNKQDNKTLQIVFWPGGEENRRDGPPLFRL
jgi:hypothetical protein